LVSVRLFGADLSHIDTAWLWRYTQSQQKVARSWSTQIDLMQRFPNHHFAASSAQQYAWLEELYPSLFTSVLEQVKAGRFHPVGGAWLEHDCVLPSGESLCRQYLYGQRYFAEKFGVRSREAWLPDTFGYASQLPQILRLSGIDYFFTQKVRSGANKVDVSSPGTTSTCSHTRLSTGAAWTGRRCWLI
jgi:alpha-mannosidase